MKTATETPTFGGHLKARREHLGLSQAQVADELDISKPGYQQYEWDLVLPEAGRLPRLAKTLKVSTSTVGRWIEDSPIAQQMGAYLRSLLNAAA